MENIGIIKWISNACLFLPVFMLGIYMSCSGSSSEQEKKVNSRRIQKMAGRDEPIAEDSVQKGKVLIAFSDCYTCHKEQEKSVGPSFWDISKKYPHNKVYIQMLAQKIIVGGSGNWGSPVMSPHPDLAFEDAKLMVSFILSLD